MINDKNDNKVQLIGYYGSDQVHACSAWTSTSRDLNEDKINRIPKLLKMLADAGHHTPFEKSAIHFLVDTDIASHIHILKHRIGVPVNGECLKTIEAHSDTVFSLRKLSNNSVISCSLDRTIKIWDIETSSCLITSNDHQNAVLCLDLF